jgi:CIC family chloride channel protein
VEKGSSWVQAWIPRPLGHEARHVGALGKWSLAGLAIGGLAGLAALLFDLLIRGAQHLFLDQLVGYRTLTVAGVTTFTLARWWALPLVAAAGGLAGGLLLWRFAPEASGIGTDAVVKAFHHGKPVPLRVAALKMATSTLTVGTGGTSGVEGPIAQVGAGLGSTVARLLRFDARDRTIAMCAGLSAGIAAAFKAPLAGALIAAEVFYHEDFEVEALLPSLMSAVVGYSVVGFAAGWQPLYRTTLDPYSFGNPATLLLYAALGVACALLTRLAFRIFFPLQALARRLWLPAATTLGATAAALLALGCIALFGSPVLIGTGHDWLQNEILGAGAWHGFLGPALLLALAALAEIAGNALTIGLGNAGGIFGPSLVAGGFLGGAFGLEAAHLWPALVPNPAPFVVVGMVAYFAGAVKAPLGTIVMVAEITGGYGMLGLAMVAVVVAFLLSGKHSLFPSQVRSRLESPAKAHDFAPLVLRQVRVRDVVRPPPVALQRATPVEEALATLQKTDHRVLPVLEGGALVGLVTRRELERVPAFDRAARTVADVMATDAPVVRPDDDLFVALQAMLASDLESVPVVGEAAPGFAGLLDRRDIHRVLGAARRQVPG